MTYVRTAWLASTNEWIVGLMVRDEPPAPLATFGDGSFVAFRQISLRDFDENGWFRADVP